MKIKKNENEIAEELFSKAMKNCYSQRKKLGYLNKISYMTGYGNINVAIEKKILFFKRNEPLVLLEVKNAKATYADESKKEIVAVLTKAFEKTLKKQMTLQKTKDGWGVPFSGYMEMH